MIEIRNETPSDTGARERLLDACFGAARFAKTSQRLRDGRLAAQGLSLTAERDGRLVGTVRLWNVEAGIGRPALLLGPLAVDPDLQGCGLGGALMRAALGEAVSLGHAAVLLVGDSSYYARFGFAQAKARGLYLPGPFERERFLGLDLRAGTLDHAQGLVRATSALAGPAAALAAKAAAADRRRAA